MHLRSAPLRVTALLAATTLALMGCGATAAENPTTATDTANTRTIAHDAGETQLVGSPEKLVTLEFSFVEALLQLDHSPVGIADDEAPDRIEQLAGKKLDYTSVGTRSEPNLEVIASLDPDLIIADTDRHLAVYAQLSEIAPTIVLNSREGDYADMKANTVTIADALGDKAAGEKVVADHEATMQEIAANMPATETRSVQLVTARDELLRIHTSSSFVGGVLEAIGRTVPVESEQAYEDASLERIAQLDPDVLLVASDVDVPVTATWVNNPLWTSMTAVRNKTVVDVDRNQYTRFRGLTSAQTIAQQVVDILAAHP